MNIVVVSGVGSGRTELSAFDHALAECGVLDFNIIPLSSVIPFGARVQEISVYKPDGEPHGKRLYAVLARQATSVANEAVGAGLGWYFFPGGGGVFVEHETIAEDEDSAGITIQTDIVRSIADLCKHRHISFDIHQVHYKIVVAPRAPIPRSAVTIAVFKVEDW